MSENEKTQDFDLRLFMLQKYTALIHRKRSPFPTLGEGLGIPVVVDGVYVIILIKLVEHLLHIGNVLLAGKLNVG